MTPRLPMVPGDSDDPVLAPVFDRFRSAGREVPELYRTLGNAPAMLAAWTGMAWPLRNDATTARGLRELIIMQVARRTETDYEWWAHRPMALQHGISEGQLDALPNWADSPQAFSEVEQAVLAAADELTEDLEVSDATFERLRAHFGAGEIVELVLTAAFYNCVSRTLRTLALEPHD